ncbi:hypothetical protein [Streptomyces olivaceoviridis]|uniref:hypothetical protein n=1 Tax=Streptomyces olivaceoviridis TaxID=1921 RepID=UPI001E4BCB16|nr:hypothetical protein [Streptomyces olivaceoviridis]
MRLRDTFHRLPRYVSRNTFPHPQGCTALADTPNGPSHSTPTTRQQALRSAAAEYHIPPGVLFALSYQESRWDSHGTQVSTDGGYGAMHLTDVTPGMLAGGGAGAAGRADLKTLAAAPALHTLRTAAKLTGLSPRELREDDEANIRGGAALLASYEKKLVGGTPADASQWYGAVARYSQATQKQSASSPPSAPAPPRRRGTAGGSAWRPTPRSAPRGPRPPRWA